MVGSDIHTTQMLLEWSLVWGGVWLKLDFSVVVHESDSLEEESNRFSENAEFFSVF